MIFVTFSLACVCFLQTPSTGYPITASWFRNRYSASEWDEALDAFKSIGGNRVILEGGKMALKSKDIILKDPDFQMCTSTYGTEEVSCVNETENYLLHTKKLNITAWMTYQFNEKFNDNVVMRCPKLDAKFTKNGHTFYRVVVPRKMDYDCQKDFLPGSGVVVILTSFYGADPQELVMASAKHRNMSVYLGIPRVPELPKTMDNQTAKSIVSAYLFFLTDRLMLNHLRKYGPPDSNKQEHDRLRWYISVFSEDVTCNISTSNNMGVDFHLKSGLPAMAAPLAGYYSADTMPLTELQQDVASDLLYISWPCFYATLNVYVKMAWFLSGVNMGFVLSPSVDMRKESPKSSIDDHVRGMRFLVDNMVIVSFGRYIIAVHEGRGRGQSAYYWPTQSMASIADTDPTLAKILNINSSVTFDDVYTGSLQQLVTELTKLRNTREDFSLMMVLEAYEGLTDNPCEESVVPSTSFTFDRTTKSRLDRGLSATGFGPQMIGASSWDPYFLCTSGGYKKNLYQEIDATMGETLIISYCGFHSPNNMSVVLIGFNVDKMYTRYQVVWTDYSKTEHQEHLYVYYVEADYGRQHGLVDGLVYVMLYDFQNVRNIQPGSKVVVSVPGTEQECIYESYS